MVVTFYEKIAVMCVTAVFQKSENPLEMLLKFKQLHVKRLKRLSQINSHLGILNCHP